MPPRLFHGWMSLGLALGLGAILAGCTSRGVSPRTSRTEPVARATTPREPDSVIEQRAQAHALYANGVILEMQGRTSRAVAAYQDAVRLDPRNEDMAWEVARRCLAARRPEAALEVLREAAGQTQASGLTWARLATLQLQSGRTDDALASAREAIRRSPDLVQGHQTLFLAHLQAARMGEARKTLEAARAHGGDDPEYLVQLAELHLVLLAHEPASRDAIQSATKELLERASALPAEDTLLRLRLADAFAAIGEDDEATQLYEELLETLPDAPGLRDNVRAKLTDAYLRGRDTESAARELRRLIEDDPTNMRAAYLLGSLAFEAREFEAARDYFRRVIILRPQFEQAYYDLAGTLLNLDQPEAAAEVVEAARGKFPLSFAMDFLSGLARMRGQEFTLALQHFARAEVTAQALDPARLNSFFYFQFGAAAERAGDFVQAERRLQQCLELSPDFAPAQNYLGYMWAERGMNLDEAESLIRKAVEAEPENAAYLDSLAWVVFKQGRAADALPYMLRALEHMEEPDATLYEHLGDIHFELGNRAEALEAWRQSLALEPNDLVAERYQRAGGVLDAEAPAPDSP